MRIQILGNVQVHGTQATRLVRWSERCVLAALALNLRKPITLTALVDFVWAQDRTDASLSSIQDYLHRIRTAIKQAGGDPDSLSYERGAKHCMLDLDPGLIDYHRFRTLAATARQHGDRDMFQRALDEWPVHTRALADVANSTWADHQRDELHALRRDVHLDLLDLQHAAGEYTEVAAALANMLDHIAPNDRVLLLGAHALARAGQHTTIPAWKKRVIDRTQATSDMPPSPGALQHTDRLAADPHWTPPPTQDVVPRQLPAASHSLTDGATERAESNQISNDAPRQSDAMTITPVGGTGDTREAWPTPRQLHPVPAGRARDLGELTDRDIAASTGGNRVLDQVADELAEAVRLQWHREEAQRRVHDPLPLAVRWHSASEFLMDHWVNICRAPANADPVPLDVAGRLDEILPLFQQIPSRRLVVIGRAGSGKTILVLRFALDLLHTRKATDPVPVIFSLGSWNPAATSLRDWLISQLTRDYPNLAKPNRESTLAAKLIDTGRVLPLLDGFDEISDGLHRRALRAINITGFPMILTSRVQEYSTAATGATVLASAAVIEIDNLTIADLIDYLPRTTYKTSTDAGRILTKWNPVLAWISANPNHLQTRAILSALSTPLMVALARSVYSDSPDQDPAELLDASRFPTPNALKDHLFSAFIPAVYSLPRSASFLHSGSGRQWDPGRAQYWLGYIASQLTMLGTRDLAWWQLGNTVVRRTRIIVFSVILGFMHSIAGGILAALYFGPTYGMIGGLIFGSAGALVNGIAGARTAKTPEPSRTQLQLRGRVKQILSGLRGGLAVGVITGLCVGSALGIASEYTIGILIGSASCLGVVFGVGLRVLTVPIDVERVADPIGLLESDRRNTVLHSLIGGLGYVLALIAGVAYALGLISGLAYGFVIGFTFGLVIGPGLGFVITAWGRWLIIVRLWLPITGRLPWSIVAFLVDAHQRGVLRQAGSVYQFRHAQIHDYLVKSYIAGRRHSQDRSG